MRIYPIENSVGARKSRERENNGGESSDKKKNSGFVGGVGSAIKKAFSFGSESREKEENKAPVSTWPTYAKQELRRIFAFLQKIGAEIPFLDIMDILEEINLQHAPYARY